MAGQGDDYLDRLNRIKKGQGGGVPIQSGPIGTDNWMGQGSNGGEPRPVPPIKKGLTMRAKKAKSPSVLV